MSNIDYNNVTCKELITIIPDEFLGIPIRKLDLPKKYDKLIEKIELINISSNDGILIPETYQGIIKLRNETFNKHTSGKSDKYLKLLNSLKYKLPQYLELYFIKILEKKSRELQDYELDAAISEIALPSYYKALIKKIYYYAYHFEHNSAKSIKVIMEINLNGFSEMQTVGKLYIRLLQNLRNEMSIYVDLSKGNLGEEIKLADNDSHKGESNSNYKIKHNDLDLLLNELEIPVRHKKLLRKIGLGTTLSEPKTVRDILNIDLTTFEQINGIGVLYVNLLKELQLQLPGYINLNRLACKHPEDKLKSLYINRQFLDPEERMILSKLSILFGANETASNLLFILNLDKIVLSKTKWFGKKSKNALDSIKRKIHIALKDLPEDYNQVDIKTEGLITSSSKIQFFDLHEIDNILIEDIEEYLWTLDEMRMDIAMSQWGFNHPYNTLEKISKRHGYTRERIRQIINDININLSNSLRLDARELWTNLRKKLSSNIESLMPNLYKCFDAPDLFYSFIEICCQVEKGSIKEIVSPEFNKSILDEFFSRTPSPVLREELINEFMSNFGYSRASSENIVNGLEKIEKIKTIDKGIIPKKLSKKTAIEHILIKHPFGLPWKDVVKIINVQGLSSVRINENRVDGAFSYSNMVYLCAHGTYRHVMFLNIENVDIKSILKNIKSFLESNKLQNIHLHDYFYRNQKSCLVEDYYTLRHIVRNFGEEYNIYFDGKSGVDSVSLMKNDERVTQSKVIVRALIKANGSMTKQEIAELLRSKSMGHASYYLANLLSEGKVVRIDRMMYTTPEKAFKNVNKTEIIQIVKDILSSTDLMVDSDVIRERVNSELNLSYSKYFYAALVKTFINQLKWYNNHSLFSTEPISYNSLYDICKQHCDLSLSIEENIKIVQKFVVATKISLSGVINNWKQKEIGNNLNLTNTNV